MSVSYTLSDIAADFGSGAKHVANSASPFLTFEFGIPPKVFKSTMVKHGGARVAWQQPVLLTGASTSRLVITAMSHKSLLPDSTIGTGVIDLAQSAAQTGPVVVQLSGKTGASAGMVQFVVTSGQGHGVGNINQPTPDSSGVVEGVGGQGRNIEGNSFPAGGGMGPGHHDHHGPGMGTGAALGAAAGAGMAHHHDHDHNRNTGMGMGNNGMGNNNMGGGMGGVGGGSGYNNNQGSGMSGGGYDNNQMVPGQQQGMIPQQQGGMMPMQQGGMMQGQQQGGMGGGMGGPQETYEKHAHNVHNHDENETFERRNVG